MNNPAGSTGLTTHQVLWGDFTRARRNGLRPTPHLNFASPSHLALTVSSLGSWWGIGKSLDA